MVVDSEDLLSILDGLARRARLPAEVYARRAFLTVLRAALEYTDATILDAERWLAYAQSLPEGAWLVFHLLTADLSLTTSCRLRARPSHHTCHQSNSGRKSPFRSLPKRARKYNRRYPLLFRQSTWTKSPPNAPRYCAPVRRTNHISPSTENHVSDPKDSSLDWKR